MKFLFIVQGEGRGHMTQAIALEHLLVEQGHQVVAVCIGKSERRRIPEFVYEKINAPIITFESPNFQTDKGQKKILLGKTLAYNFLKINRFLKSLRAIHQIVKTEQADVIINFYDLLGGLYNCFYKKDSKFWVVGHQYLIDHPEFLFAPSKRLERSLFILNTKLTALFADKILALSFRHLESQNPKLFILPPLLRKELFKLDVRQGHFILTYMVNSGYGEEVIEFAKNNPQMTIEAFWDNINAQKIEHPLPNLIFHQIDDQLFLKKMASCRGLLSTAGFESICEAMYLNKPVMMVPVAGQYEQACNALDAVASGAGIIHHEFNFEFFAAYLDQNMHLDCEMKTWCSDLPKILNQLTQESASSLALSHWTLTSPAQS